MTAWIMKHYRRDKTELTDRQHKDKQTDTQRKSIKQTTQINKEMNRNTQTTTQIEQKIGSKKPTPQ